MGNKDDYVDLGSSCAQVCGVLERGLRGIESEDLNETVVEAINQLKT